MSDGKLTKLKTINQRWVLAVCERLMKFPWYHWDQGCWLSQMCHGAYTLYCILAAATSCGQYVYTYGCIRPYKYAFRRATFSLTFPNAVSGRCNVWTLVLLCHSAWRLLNFSTKPQEAETKDAGGWTESWREGCALYARLGGSLNSFMGQESLSFPPLTAVAWANTSQVFHFILLFFTNRTQALYLIQSSFREISSLGLHMRRRSKRNGSITLQFAWPQFLGQLFAL